MERLKEVTEKIYELLKGSDLDPMKEKRGMLFKTHYYGICYAINIDNHSIYAYDQEKGLPRSISKRDILNVIGSPIREAEILMALGESKSQNFYEAIDYSGNFIENYCGEYENSPHSWTLGKSLSEQSKETIESLHEILVR